MRNPALRRIDVPDEAEEVFVSDSVRLTEENQMKRTVLLEKAEATSIALQELGCVPKLGANDLRRQASLRSDLANIRNDLRAIWSTLDESQVSQERAVA